MISALVTGVLSYDPTKRETKTGGAMATATLAAEVGASGKVFIGLVAFNELADELLRCGRGCAVSVRGRLELNRWTNADGQPREGWQVVADSLLVGPERPSLGRSAPKRGYHAERATRRFLAQPEPPPFDDQIGL